MLIPIHNRKLEVITHASVDPEVYSEVAQFRWFLHTEGYAQRTVPDPEKRRRTILMHREVLSPPQGTEIDHRNGDRLDNRRANLRAATKAENQRNSRSRRGSSSVYKGVCWDTANGKWKATITVHRRTKHLGRYKSEREAALAYNAAALQHFGEFARPNFVA